MEQKTLMYRFCNVEVNGKPITLIMIESSYKIDIEYLFHFFLPIYQPKTLNLYILTKDNRFTGGNELFMMNYNRSKEDFEKGFLQRRLGVTPWSKIQHTLISLPVTV